MASELARVIEQVEKDKGIDRSVLVEALELALLTAAQKKFGLGKDIEAQYNPELGEIELFQFKTVVESIANNNNEIAYDAAVDLDPEVALGDSIGVKMDASVFGRIAAQTAKQVIIQKVRDAERDIIYKEFNVRKGEVVSGVCRRIEKGCIIVDLGRTDAILPAREQIPGEHYRPGDRVLGFLIDVQQTPRGPKIVLSRTCSELLIQLFHQEVPEVAEGIVTIRAAAREPGVRAKIGVESKDPDVDPVGACVGVKGSRVQNVVQELRGEKIDIVPFSEDETRFVCNALAPAEVQKVFIDEEGRAMEIVVADDQLSLAIGKKGQNVKLASMVSGWKLDILSETKVAKRLEEIKSLLMRIEGMTETIAQSLYYFGYTVETLAKAEVEALGGVAGMTPEKVAQIKEGAKQMVESGELKKAIQEQQAAAVKPIEAPVKMTPDAVFERLKAEVKAHEDKEKTDIEAKAAEGDASAAGDEAVAEDSSGSPEGETESPGTKAEGDAATVTPEAEVKAHEDKEKTDIEAKAAEGDASAAGDEVVAEDSSGSPEGETESPETKAEGDAATVTPEAEVVASESEAEAAVPEPKQQEVASPEALVESSEEGKPEGN